MRYTDRSRILEYQRCPRARWFGYEIYGTGVRKVAASIPLVTGAEVHVGWAALLQGKGIEEAIITSLQEYDVICSTRGLAISETEDHGYVVSEQRALIEALLRAYNIVGLPVLLEQYDVVDVETERLNDLAPGLVLMSRPDALLREKESGDLYVLSYKTAATWDKRRAKEAEHDDQGLSEVIGVEANLQPPEKVMGIRMEFMLKGERKEYPEDSGRYVQWSPLIRGYRKQGVTPGTDEWASRYSWKCAEEHECQGVKKHWTCPGGKKHTLSGDWERVDMWTQPGGIKWWIDWLAQHDRALLEEQLVVPVTFFRHQDDMDAWKRQRVKQEIDVGGYAHGAEAYRTEGDREAYMEYLDCGFYQHRRACDWPSACQFQAICFEGADPMDPLSDSSYQKRVPHHEAELVQITGVGQ